jgi:cytoskeleton protein RodZ
MTDIQPENTSAAPIDAVPFDVGSVLREARQRLGLSVADVTDRIKFAPRQIEALEANDFAHLPEIAFLRGFVRSYAKLLQIDAAPLLAALPQAAEPAIPQEARGIQVTTSSPDIYTERKNNLVWLAAAFVVALALALAAWLLKNPPASQTAETAPPPAAKTSEVALAPPQATPVSAIPDTPASSVEAVKPAASGVLPQSMIHLTFDLDTWVEITDKNGKILVSQLSRGGTEQNLDGTPPFSLVIGHGKAAHLTYKGQPVDLAPYTKTDVARLTLE